MNQKTQKSHAKVIIGIPAYNEANSLPNLISDLQKQITHDVFSFEILVVSDGSTDDTVKKAKLLKLHNLKVIVNKNRNGKSEVVNQILEKSKNADAIVLLDADIRLLNNQTIFNITKPVLNKSADLVTAKVAELPARNILQRILTFSMNFKREMFESIRNGNNLYTCHGRIRAFSPLLAKQLRIPSNSSEDAYSYLFAKKQKYSYHYLSNLSVYYQLPTNLNDHLKQSQRFFRHTDVLSPYFSEKYIEQEYNLPKTVIFKTSAKYALRNPIYFLCYFGLLALAKLLPTPSKNTSHLWSVATSSKHTSHR